jgi:hypothetical protein
MLRHCLMMGLVAIAAVAPAGAQTTQSSDPDTSTIRLGPLGITPTLMLRELGRDENVFNERENPKSDFTFTVEPRADLVFRPRGLKVTFTTASQYVYYREYKSERSTNTSAAVRVDFLLARFQPFVIASGKNTRERLNQEVDERARHHERVLGGGLNIKIGTRLTVGASARTTRLTFDEEANDFRGEDLARSFNNTNDAVDASAALQLTPFTLLTVAVTHEDQRFPLAPERDARSIRVSPTFSFSPEAVLTGSVSVGFRRFMPRTSALEPFTGVVAAATIGSTLWNRHRVEVLFGRDLRYSYETDTPYYLATGGTVTVTTQLVGPFDVRATGTRHLLEYRGNQTTLGEPDPGDDTATGYGFGAGYRIRERLRLGINADWSRRESQISSDREYRNRRIFASLTWGNQT